MKRITTFLLLILTCIYPLHAQMARELVNPNKSETAIFKAPIVVLTNSVKNLYKNTLFMTINHTFGPVNSGVNELFGLDVSADIRLGLDYGISDRLSVGLGRTRYNKTIDGRFKYTLLYQTTSNSSPVQLSMAGDVGIITLRRAFQGSYNISDKMNFMYMMMAARKFSNKLSIQVAPVYAHYNRVFTGEHNDYFGVSLAGRYKVTDHMALAVEYIPQVNKPDDLHNTISLGLNIETGSHVFQLFLSNTEYYNQQDILRHTRGNFWAGNIHFGFNVTRIFTFGAEGLHY